MLKDIIKLPEVECRDQLNTNNFDIHFKSPPSQIRFTAHHEDIKSLWLTEIGQYVNDQLALHEHAIDDLRIDPTQVKSDTENDGFRLPHRIEAYISDGVKPSEIARDYYLPHIEKKTVKDEESQIVVQKQQQIVQQQQQTIQQQQQQTVHQQQQQQQQAVQTVEAKVSSVKSEQIVQHQTTSTAKTVFTEQKQQISQTVDSHSHATVEKEKSTKAVADKLHQTVETKITEQRSTVRKVEDQQKSVEIKSEEKQQYCRLTRNNAIEQQDSTASAAKGITVVDTKSPTTTADTNKQVTPKSGTHCVQIILPESAPPASHNNQIALLPSDFNKTHASNPQDADTNQNQSSASNTASGSGAGGGGRGGGVDRNPERQLYPFQSVSYFNFGDRQGGGGDGLTPRSNLPDFLVPPHLITYQTTFEISVRKIPFPDPPTPPKYMKKLVAQTDSLEKRTRDFLSARFTSTSTGDALRTARQKMRSLKSMIMLSDDEVRHAEDTIVKAKHGDFQRIYNPYLGAEKPQYEFVELPSEGECSEEVTDKQSERGTSEQRAQTTMDEQYSSKYSSRSSRKERRTEGNMTCEH